MSVRNDKSVWDTKIASEEHVKKAGTWIRSRKVNSLIGIENEQTVMNSSEGELGI